MKHLFALSFVLVCISAHAQKASHLFVVNGTFVQPGREEIVNKIPVDQIESLTTLNSIEATSKYGEFLGGNGMVFIKVRFDASRPLDFPNEAMLTYGDKKPVTVLNGKIIDSDKMNELTEASGHARSISVSRTIDFIEKYGLQAINGVVTVTTE